MTLRFVKETRRKPLFVGVHLSAPGICHYWKYTSPKPGKRLGADMEITKLLGLAALAERCRQMARRAEANVGSVASSRPLCFRCLFNSSGPALGSFGVVPKIGRREAVGRAFERKAKGDQPVLGGSPYVPTHCRGFLHTCHVSVGPTVHKRRSWFQVKLPSLEDSGENLLPYWEVLEASQEDSTAT